MTSKVVSKLRTNVNNRKVPTRFMMLKSSYVHYLKTVRILEGSFRDFLDSVSVEISEKNTIEFTLDFVFNLLTTDKA